MTNNFLKKNRLRISRITLAAALVLAASAFAAAQSKLDKGVPTTRSTDSRASSAQLWAAVRPSRSWAACGISS